MAHNEALTMLDLLALPVVQAANANTPPVDPSPGDCWIVGASPTGPWVGHARAIAGWTDGGWRFLAPRAGMATWSIADGQEVRFVDGGWVIGNLATTTLAIGGHQVVGAQRPAIANPTGGATIDSEARAALGSVLAALRTHGLIAT